MKTNQEDGSVRDEVYIAGTASGILQEQLTNADADTGTLTFSAPITSIGIENTDDTNAGVFTVNGIAITVPAGGSFKSAIGGTPSAEITVTGSTSYIVSRYT